MQVRIVNHVREHRQRLGLTQEELAEMSEVSRQSIISIERGRYVPSLPLALRLAEIFRCPTDELFQRVEEEKR